MQEQYFCMFCGDIADGFIEMSLGWRGEPVTRVYLCRKHYRMMYYNEMREKWHELQEEGRKEMSDGLK